MGCGSSSNSTDINELNENLSLSKIQGKWISNCMILEETYLNGLFSGIFVDPGNRYFTESFEITETDFILKYEMYSDLSCENLSSFDLTGVIINPKEYGIDEYSVYYTSDSFQAIKLLLSDDSEIEFSKINDSLYRVVDKDGEKIVRVSIPYN